MYSALGLFVLCPVLKCSYRKRNRPKARTVRRAAPALRSPESSHDDDDPLICTI